MLLKSEDGLGLGYISIVVLVRESFWLLRNWNGKGPLTYDQDKISHRQSTKHRFYEKIITTKEVVQTKMLTEKEEGEEQKKGEKKSELTGTVAILFYWGLPSHVLLRVCKFPLSCLLLHLEPRCKRRDLTALSVIPQHFLLGHSRLHTTPSSSPFYQCNCVYNPFYIFDQMKPWLTVLTLQVQSQRVEKD